MEIHLGGAEFCVPQGILKAFQISARLQLKLGKGMAEIVKAANGEAVTTLEPIKPGSQC